ncbi:putative bifunctional diguanylate cyclase/phosphodiesterase [Amorphus sp. 3PC139-8]|uniref:putative bifunctional diguanylate cyclase/phosphodiesterase n=1 Tax=Amorphus sp. 3PC139-8 TaxID=2735676 RepID=UPI00345D8DE7
MTVEVKTSRGVWALYLVIVTLALLAFAGLIRSDILPAIYRAQHTPAIWTALQLIQVFVVAISALIAILVVYLINLRQAIARREKAEEAARKLALYDPLTGLPNRHNFEQSFEKALTEAGEMHRSVGLVFMDLDRFRAVNDLHGHGGGDRVLQGIAQRIKTIVGSCCLVARLGADEFAVAVLSEGNDGRIVRTVQQLLREVREPIALGGSEVTVTASIGIAVWPQDGKTRELLMQRADLSMMRAKADGRNTYATFDSGFDASLRKRLSLEGDLRRAIDTGQVMPHFQPFVRLDTGELVGFEVLARWTHPVKGRIGPDVFIQMAVDLGVIDRLFETVLEVAAREAMTWERPLCIAVNASPAQLKSQRMLQTILDCLKRTGLPAGRLEIEITEDAIVEDFKRAQDTIVALKSKGVGISLDDFGTGYSSLKHLYELPVDKIKLDNTIIGHRRDGQAVATIVDLVILLAHRLELKVTAEGIETEEDAAWLKTHGCDFGQGYLYSPAVPAAEARELVAGPARRQAAE